MLDRPETSSFLPFFSLDKESLNVRILCEVYRISPLLTDNPDRKEHFCCSRINGAG